MAKRIDVDDVNVYYSDFLAVEGASINIAPLSVTAFIGPSGCGKSTFLRILNRMHEVIPGGRVSGSVLLDGEDLYGPGVDPVNVRRTVGMVFQKANPFPTHVDLRQRHRRLQDRRHPQVQERHATTSSSGRCAARTCGKRSSSG